MMHPARRPLIALFVAMQIAATLGAPLHHAADESPGHASRPEAAFASSAEHCPICEYLAQGQIAIEPGHDPYVARMEIAAPSVSAILRPDLAPCSARPRAPPVPSIA